MNWSNIVREVILRETRIDSYFSIYNSVGDDSVIEKEMLCTVVPKDFVNVWVDYVGTKRNRFTLGMIMVICCHAIHDIRMR